MTSGTIRVIVVAVVWAGLPAALVANSPPVVGNVTASHRSDGSKKVDIRYNLAVADGDACTVSVLVALPQDRPEVGLSLLCRGEPS